MSPTITTGQRLQLTATKTARIRAKSGGNTLGTFEGNAYTGAPMKPGGWYQPVVIDLAGVRIPSQHRPVLRQHDHQQIVGHTTSVKATRKGLMVAGTFSGERKHRDSVVVPARNGFQWQLSVGAEPIRTEQLHEGETTTVNGREVVGPMMISRETELGEISFVPLGADGQTSVSIAAQAAGFTSAGIMQPAYADEVRRIQAALNATPSAPPAPTRRFMDFNPGLSALAGDGNALGHHTRYDIEGRAYGSEYGGDVSPYRRGVLSVPETMRGTALIFGRMWAPGPVLEADWRTVRSEGWRPIIFKGALDQALADLRSGKLTVPLLLDHDASSELTRSDEGAFRLRLTKDGERVRFRLDTDTTAGRLAARVIAASQSTGLSLGLHGIQTIEIPDLPLILGVVKASIRDISVVRTPRCPGARLEL
jgi:HK97 family phage prohead protease